METLSMSNTAAREALPLPVTALILAGRRSQRMGRSKAFLPFAGKTIIQHLLDTASGLFDELFVVANEPDSYSQLGVEILKDILPHRGPLAGILSGLLVAKNTHVFVLACDMPLVTPQLIRDMSQQRHGQDVLVLSHGQGVEPLLGLYSKACIKPLEESLFADRLKVQDFLDGLKGQTFAYSEDLSHPGQLPPYFNVNTPQEYSEVLNRSKSFNRASPVLI